MGWREPGRAKAVVATLVGVLGFGAGSGAAPSRPRRAMAPRVSSETRAAQQDWLQAGPGRCWVDAAVFYGKNQGDNRSLNA